MTKTDNALRGNAVWQDFEKTNRFPNRTWQSLKERFIKHIVPRILEDRFQTPLWVRKMILVGWTRSAQNSRPTNITKSWEELLQIAEEAGVTFQSDDEECITLSKDCKQGYEEIVQEKKHRYIVMHIKDEYEISVEYVGARNEDYNEFLADLQLAGAKECRYGLFDWEDATDIAGTSTDTGNIHKLFLMLWCPNTAASETRNMYKRSMNILKENFKDVKDYIEATNISEAHFSVIKAKLQENSASKGTEVEAPIEIIDDDSMAVEDV
ncbi:unnamed protein product [Callosobruchus maculatus]|nr:unnamed protein product [Callosobruchus maculatus]